MSSEVRQSESGGAWMVVVTTNDESEAHVIVGRLQYEGIQAFVHREPAGAAYGITIGRLGESRVVVHPDDYAAALAILDDDVADEAIDYLGDGVIEDDVIAYLDTLDESDEDDEGDDERA